MRRGDLDMRKNWQTVSLGEVSLKIGSGATPLGGSSAYHESGIMLVRSMNVHIDRFEPHGLVFLNKAQADALAGAEVFSGDVLLNITGASIGRVTTAPDEAHGARVNQHVCIIRTPSGLSSRFVTLFLASPQQQQMIMDEESGATRQALTKAKIESFQIPLPPSKEQERIVDKVEALRLRSGRALRALDGIPVLLDRLRQSILAAAFRGDLTADWRARNPDVEPADKLLEKIRAERRRRWEETELARLTAKGKPPVDDRWKARYTGPMQIGAGQALSILPDGWSWVALDEIVEIFDSSRIPLNLEQRSARKGVYPYYGASGVIDYVDDYLFDGEYLLIAEDGANLLSRSSPRAFPAEGKFWVNNHAHIVKTLPPLGDGFVECFVNTISLAPFVTGTAQPKLTQKSLTQIPVPLPPEAEVEQIIALIDRLLAPLEGQAQAAQSLVGMLDDLDARILAKAFRGELVPQDPEDEPASVLLSRLRDDAAVTPAKPRRARTSVPADNSARSEREPLPARPNQAPLTTSIPLAVDASAPARQPISAVPPTQQSLRLAAPIADFVDLTAEAQTTHIHRILLGEGPLDREDAIRRAAEILRDAGQASFQRLRRDGTLATCIDAALAVGLRQGHFDRPRPGIVRAVARDAAQVLPALWRRALLAALAEPAADDAAAVRAAAAWSQAQFGLEFQRLRAGGHIDTALRAALVELITAGEVTRDRNGALTLRTRPG